MYSFTTIYNEICLIIVVTIISVFLNYHVQSLLKLLHLDVEY